ncbi:MULTISPECIES: DUF2889 domain-containing protein [unclassified Pseudomonas]|jgi:hypothetical protein|uniref:DUF2889 domain-containing protein n=1 Tax=unclassified Pseudomonas TaxID=196821 RepID=UPI00069D7743|nr:MULTISPECIES: DUF2889 domain-containing protein [unclassified Pseudomonas]WPN44694.1 DUF2889 domain-containing protein [Pseudomonas sp. P8_241]
MKQPVSGEKERQPLHTRQVICTGYLRSDGLIDLEGTLLDSKHHDHDAFYKVITAGAPVHRMRIVITADLQFNIRNVEAVMDDFPTPFCPEIVSAYKSLIGLKVGPGFKKQMIQRVGGVQGCTHLTELLGPMATTLYQSTVDLLREAERERAAREPGYVVPKPWFLGTCHAHHPDREEVRKRWPDTALERVRLITDGL